MGGYKEHKVFDMLQRNSGILKYIIAIIVVAVIVASFFVLNYLRGEDIFNRGLCLPSDIKMSPEEQAQVISRIKGLF